MEEQGLGQLGGSRGRWACTQPPPQSGGCKGLLSTLCLEVGRVSSQRLEPLGNQLSHQGTTTAHLSHLGSQSHVHIWQQEEGK